MTLVMAVIASSKEKMFPHIRNVPNCVLPGTMEQICAFFTIQQWLDRLTYSTTHQEVIEVFALFLDTTWADRHNEKAKAVYPFPFFTRRDAHA